MFLTFLIAAHLHFIHQKPVATLHYTNHVIAQLHKPTLNGIKLQPSYLTIVKTWQVD